METTRNWLLPAVLVAAQLALLVAAPDLGFSAAGPWAVVGVLIATAIGTVALGHRRRRPAHALGGALAAGLVGSTIAPDHYFDVGVLVALYSVTVRCTGRATAVGAAAAVVCEWAVQAAYLQDAPLTSVVLERTLTVVMYVGCVGLGQVRRRWLTARRVAARRLVLARADQRAAAETERHRLARELHDVSAHHLTSVVVTADAAARLGSGRPELVADALSFSRSAGQEALATLRRLVALMREGDHPDPRPMSGRIQHLIADFSRLGRPVVTDLPPDLAGPSAEAVFGIVREALTNALRYAPQAPVRVQVRRADGVLAVIVHNDAPRSGGRQPEPGLGSGYGIEGMRERAAALGGTLSAGPDETGGWRVLAHLPDTTGPVNPPVLARRRSLVAEQWLTGAAQVLVVASLPPLSLLIDVEDGSAEAVGPALWVTLVLLSVLHGLPLMWRRQAPWVVLWCVLATAWLWPIARVVGLLPSAWTGALHLAALAEVFAVYALVVYRGGARTWVAVPVATCGVAVSLTVLGATDGSLQSAPASLLNGVLAAVLFAIGAGSVLALVWGAGLVVRRRRLRVVAREEHEIVGAELLAADVVAAERRLIAMGLQEEVLHRTQDVADAASRGELGAVAAAARSALEAMRELLHRLREPGRYAPSGPVEEVTSSSSG